MRPRRRDRRIWECGGGGPWDLLWDPFWDPFSPYASMDFNLLAGVGPGEARDPENINSQTLAQLRTHARTANTNTKHDFPVRVHFVLTSPTSDY